MLVTWVPLHLTRRLRRGFDQAQLMARIFARHTGLPLVPTLRRRRRTAPQSTLHANDARQRNVRDAFAARRIDLTDWHIVLIDDVKTSGATLTQCCRLLRNQGAARIDAAVATVADPKRADFAHE
jgi:ComF family protein